MLLNINNKNIFFFKKNILRNNNRFFLIFLLLFAVFYLLYRKKNWDLHGFYRLIDGYKPKSVCEDFSCRFFVLFFVKINFYFITCMLI